MTGLFVCAATLLPWLRFRTWWIRVFDFPRVQISALGLLAFAAGAGKYRSLRPADKIIFRCVGGAVLAQSLQICKYSRLFPRPVLRNRRADPQRTIKLLVANVRMKNREVWKVLQLVESVDPDIILLLEPNKWWLEQLAELEGRYPWAVKVPQENTYGMALYTRFELAGLEVRRLVQRDVPSIRAWIQFGPERGFWFYAVHPRPPVRGNLEGDVELSGSTKRDAELIRVALEIPTLDAPAIVAGDFNDVAWSHTTRRFQRLGRLMDPRIGRGLYNTYHAKHPLLRFPLDHLFHSKEFSVVQFDRGAEIGSDHFPILATLALETPGPQQPPVPSPGDKVEATETLKDAMAT